MLNAAPVAMQVTVDVPQRSGRPARTATLTLRARKVRLRRPRPLPVKYPRTLMVNVVVAREEEPPPNVEPLDWMLFTTEPVGTPEQIMTVLSFYRTRWRIEEFHKAWKTGAGVERLRLQHADNLLRMAAILAFVAVRLLQLRELVDLGMEVPVDQVLRPVEWKVLWVAIEKTPPPAQRPSSRSALVALGRLA